MLSTIIIHRKYFLVALTSGLLTSTVAHASCLNSNADSRLRAYCVAKTLEDRLVTRSDAQVLDVLLKREGYARGIGLPTQVEPTSLQPFVAPILDYNRNINAGNPNRPLVLGGLTFTGDEENLRKAGIVTGVGVGINGRHLYGEGRYLDFAIGASYAHSPKYDIGITRAFVNLCSRNHLQHNWYVDGCANSTRMNRDLANETKSNLKLSTSKLFSTSRTAHHAATVGIQRYFEHDSYRQNQLLLGWQAVRSEGFYSALNVSLGEAVSNTLAMRHNINATLGTVVFDRELTVSMNYSFSDGGALLGVERRDTTYSATINYAIHPRVNAVLGYKRTNSSIDYFNEREPIVGIQIAPLRF